MYCTYLTIYKGNLLPRRYIGSSRVDKIIDGYRGSVSSKQWKHTFDSEIRSSPHLFKTRILKTFVTREEATNEELRLHILYDVVKSNLYMNQSIARPNGFFGRDVSGENNPMYGKKRTGEKHLGGENISKALKKLYNSDEGKELLVKRKQLNHTPSMLGKRHTEETKQKMSESRTGENNGMFGKTHTEDAKNKMSERVKERIESGWESPLKGVPMSDENKQKLRGKKRTDETRQKLRKKYIIDDSIIVDDAKKFCLDNGHSYTSFSTAANNGKLYKGMLIRVLDTP